MYIRSDENGNINLISIYDIEGCQLYNGALPTDFYETVGLGKYLFIDGQIVAAIEWEFPAIPEIIP
ncbi:hypothetical protein HQ865_01145 [Mucilaginibacter mali]|uniref:Uncharacterized protein n=1 Tax=Mucilaginibacter mali TaxID=2740462 RepID=A0A7D4UMQ2_9SPHI|nr:hypothetical protein [Mucilaginibacter mali]QKJ28420.1 hypothetical protein HQ865_01145 [Mucilaginibacter mali]